jgi:hypothetical protein
MSARALLAAALLCAASPCLAGESDAAPAWLQPIAGQKLIAVDGSTLKLSQTEGGMALSLTAANGGARNASFAFMSDKLGTISDDASAGHVIGFFRETDTGLEATFADGRNETLIANMEGGVSLQTRADNGDAQCTSWYPQNHAFSEAERRAALAAFADRLGIADHGKKAAPRPPQTCIGASPRIAKAKPQAAAPTPAHAATAPLPPYKIGMYNPATSSGAAGLAPVVVRTSEVHLIDAAPTAPLSAIPPAPAPQPTAPVPQPHAAAPAPQTTATTTAAASDGHGASDCLTVERDGANLGFRNHCGYGVQFAYCLQKASDPAADCGASAKAGAVEASGFAAVLTDTDLKSAEADFRWVACSGANGSVVAHLDRADPPEGRCVRANAS